MKNLSSYQSWDEAFYHEGAKGSPKTPRFDYDVNEFFVKGLTHSQHDPRTMSAFSHWVVLYGKLKLDPAVVISLLKSVTLTSVESALLGFYLDLIADDKFQSLYQWANKIDSVVYLVKVTYPDPKLIKWGLHGKSLDEIPSKYLILDPTKNRIF